MQRDYSFCCVAAIGSMTLCIKAQHALLDHGIAARVISLLPRETRRGCAFGVSFACESDVAAHAILRKAGIPVSQFFKREGNAP